MEGLIRPGLRTASRFQLKLFSTDSSVNPGKLSPLGEMNLSEEIDIPQQMQVAGTIAALLSSELDDVNMIAAFGVFRGMHGLVDVTYQVHQKFQCLGSRLKWGIPVRQHTVEEYDSIYNAIANSIVRKRGAITPV